MRYVPSARKPLQMTDALHPDTASHERIGRRFVRYAFAGDGPFAIAQ
jgi:hypothetical protein